MSVPDQLKDLTLDPKVTDYSSPTIIDTDLKMNSTWKTSLALDAKLPLDIDFSLEGIYSRDYNPAVITNLSRYWDGTFYIELSPGDKRRLFKKQGKDAYMEGDIYSRTAEE